MLFTLGLLIICLIITSPIFIEDKRFGLDQVLTVSLITTIIMSVIIGGIVGSSYWGYVNLKQDKVNIEQYAETINLYSKLTVPNELKSAINNELTDFKYQNYQTGIKELVQELRRRVVKYNQILIGKREFGNNIVFNWLIIMPDKDMKTVLIKDIITI